MLTRAQEVQKKRTSKYVGVTWRRDIQKWVAYVTDKKVRYECGYHDDERTAAKSRDRKILALGLNKPLQILKKA
jgi:hypothetical protein